MKKYFSILVLLILTLLVSACGYRLRGTQELAGGSRTVAVLPFVNKTVETRIEADFFNALVDEFAQSKNLKIVPVIEAEFLVTGVISAVDNYSISYSSDDKTYEYRVVMIVNAEIKERATNHIIWQRSSLQQVEEYKSTGEPLTIDRRKQRALKRICKILAEDIHDGIFRDF